jgi:hypothetical protein
MEFITTTTHTNKNGHNYYTQVFTTMNVDNECNFKEVVTWKGKAKKEDFEWCKMIAETQPERLVMNENNILVIKN